MSAVLPQSSGRNPGSLMVVHQQEQSCGTAPPEPVRARRTDPITSHEAAARAALFAKGHASRILLALEQLGSATASELAAHTVLTVVQIDRRLPELEKAGKVRVLQVLGKPLVRNGYRVWARVAA